MEATRTSKSTRFWLIALLSLSSPALAQQIVAAAGAAAQATGALTSVMKGRIELDVVVNPINREMQRRNYPTSSNAAGRFGRPTGGYFVCLNFHEADRPAYRIDGVRRVRFAALCEN